jgi:hypothetical protein
LAYGVFLSHSFKDKALVNELQSFDLPGINLYVAEADPQYGDSLAEKIEQKIESSDALAVLLTKNGSSSASLNQEVGYAKRAHKRVIALVEEGASVGVLLQGTERINFTIDKVGDALEHLARYVKAKAINKRQIQLFWLAISATIIVLVAIVLVALVLVPYWKRKKSP